MKETQGCAAQNPDFNQWPVWTQQPLTGAVKINGGDFVDGGYYLLMSADKFAASSAGSAWRVDDTGANLAFNGIAKLGSTSVIVGENGAIRTSRDCTFLSTVTTSVGEDL